MESKLNLFKENISELLGNKNIIVDSVLYTKEKKYSFLTITLDRLGGIDLDTIVDATKIINKELDKMDFIDESFILDVVSKENG